MYRVLVLLALIAWSSPDSAHCQDMTVVQEWKAVLEWEVGDYDGPAALTTVSDLLADPGGRIYVTQPETHEVWVFGPDGTRDWVFGREGRGPGEFISPQSLAWRGDSVVVWDPKLNRINLFSSGGQFLRSFPGTPLASRLALLGEESLVRVHGVPYRRIIGGQVTSNALKRQNLLTGRIDTLSLLSVAHSALEVNTGLGTGYGQQPFSDDPLWRVGPHGKRLVLVERAVGDIPDPPVFLVTVFDTEGKVRLTESVRFLPVRLTRERIETVAAEHANRIKAGMMARGVEVPRAAYSPESFREAYFLPKVHPPVEALALDPDGGIWLRRETDGRSPTVNWMVLDNSAKPTAYVKLPIDLELVFPSGDHLWAARRDEMDVFHILRYRLIRPGADSVGSPPG